MRELKIVSKRAFIVLASVCALSFMGCKMKTGADQEAAPAAAPVAAAPAAAAAPAVDISVAPSQLNLAALPKKGAANAKVTIVEFSDFECPFCSRVEPTLAQILKDYPNDVQIAFINMPLPLHKNAMPAAKASVAALKLGGSDAFWKLHEKFFANQKNLSVDFFKAAAAEAGLDAAAFEAAMNSDEVTKYINSGVDAAKGAGLGGTPSFLINGVQLVGAQPPAAFKAAIDEQIKRADEVAKAKNLSGDALYQELVKTAPKPKAEEPEEDTNRRFIDIAGAPVLGEANSPVTIVEFTDFECPFCSRANTTIHDLLAANPGKANLIYRAYPLPFHKNAKLAAQAAEAAKAQGKFWEYYDKLFANQKALDRDALIGYAKELGLDEAKFVADMDADATVKAVEKDMELGGKAGVKGTPHFLLNGRILSGAQPITAFQNALDEELQIVDKLTKEGIAADQLYKTIAERNIKPEPLPIVVDIAGAPFKGAENAPVTLVQFSEFQCPFCKRVEPTIDALLADPAYAGKIKVVFKQFPLPFHNNAQKASEAAMGVLAIAGQDAFWKMHKVLFENQGALEVDNLLKYAKEAGLTDAQVETLKADLDSNKYADAVKKDAADGAKAGTSGTPTFVINGKLLVGAQPIDAFKKAIDEALANVK